MSPSEARPAASRKVLLTILVLGGLAGTFFFLSGWFRFDAEVARYRKLSEDELTQRLPKEVSPTEAIVVLTGDQRRIPKALQLLRRRGSPLLIISGTGRGTTLTALVNGQGDSARDIRDVWQKILLEPKSTSTIENAEETARIVGERHLSRLILVTSDYHMPRSERLFRSFLPNIGLYAYPVVPPPEAQGTAEDAWHLGMEYWKYFIFDHFVFAHLEPY